MRLKHAGWTLVELLAVLLISATLIGLSYPRYTNYLREIRRTEATRTLLELAALQEQWFSRHFAYATALGDLTESVKLSDHYLFSLSQQQCPKATAPDCFELNARPKASSPQAEDLHCSTLQVTHLGQQTPTACW